MKSLKHLVFLFAVLAVAVLTAVNVSAFGSISSVEVSGVEGLTGAELAAFAGETLPVRVVFTASSDAEDVRIKAWISGAREYSASTERFDVLADHVYSKLISVAVPHDIDPAEDLKLEVVVESQNDGTADAATINLAAQRESYEVEVLDVSMSTTVKAGSSLAIDVVLKNRGRQFAEDTFVKVSVPALGVEQKAYFGDLSPVDQSNPDKEDAVERRLLLNVPSSAPAGVYLVEVAAYNADSSAVVAKKVVIVGASADTMVLSSSNSKTFAAGEKGSYTITLVNSGDKIQVYQLVFDASTGLNVDAEESVFAVPAGASKTVKVTASAQKAGKYNFAANVHSDGELVKSETFTADVEGRSSRSLAGNGTVLLTVILAVIFVVLLVVLMVLLTRKPKKAEEFGESYY